MLKFTGIGTAAYYISHGIYTKEWRLSHFFDWTKKPDLSVEQALHYVEGQVLNNASEQHLRNDIRLGRDETTQTLSTF